MACVALFFFTDVAGAAALILQADPSTTGMNAARNIVNLASQNKISGAGITSPNRLLYVGDYGSASDAVAANVLTASEDDPIPRRHARIKLTVVYDNSPKESRVELDSLYAVRYWTNVESWTVNDDSNDVDDLVVMRDLPEGFYSVNFYDSGGDGFCCGDGNGSYKIERVPDDDDSSEHDERNVLASGGEFGAHTTVELVVFNGKVEVVDPDAI